MRRQDVYDPRARVMQLRKAGRCHPRPSGLISPPESGELPENVGLICAGVRINERAKEAVRSTSTAQTAIRKPNYKNPMNAIKSVAACAHPTLPPQADL